MANDASDTVTSDIRVEESDVEDTSEMQDAADQRDEVGTRPTLNLNPDMPKSILRIPVSLQVVIGSTRLPLAQIAKLTTGSTVALEQKLGAPATILVNGREVAKGEIFVLDDEGVDDRLGITITEVLESRTPEGL